MPPLLKIRSERDQMSAIERRIADFLLENAHLLRDYSSQQLADALQHQPVERGEVQPEARLQGLSGPEVLGRRGSRARNGSNGGADGAGGKARPHAALAESLWRAKAKAEEETRLINTPDKIDEIASLIGAAGKVFLIGLGEDSVSAQAFAAKLVAVGLVAVYHADPVLMSSTISTVAAKDVLLVFSEQGKQPTLYQICRQFRERRGKVISVTRHTANPLRAHCGRVVARVSA